MSPLFASFLWAVLLNCVFPTVPVDAKACQSRKPKAAGGSGGVPFDSGCDPSGIEVIRIKVGQQAHYRSTIKRVYLDYKQPEFSDAGTDAMYHGWSSDHHQDTEFTVKLNPRDPVVKAVVHTDGKRANAVQFHTRSGIISPMYGIASSGSQLKAVEFSGDKLVGVYGRFGDAMDSLGFAFASTSSTISANRITRKERKDGTSITQKAERLVVDGISFKVVEV